MKICRNQRTLILILFFASGFSGLVYEIVWTRLLSLVFGNSVYASATVLAGFMGGLAVGSLVFGKIADRLHYPLKLCGILELLVGGFALTFPSLLQGIEPLYRWYSNTSGGSYQSVSLAQAVLLACILVPPTALMGGTLSLLARQITKAPEELQGNISSLYGINTLGGLLGCVSSAFVLIASFGVRETTWIAISITVATGIIFINKVKP